MNIKKQIETLLHRRTAGVERRIPQEYAVAKAWHAALAGAVLVALGLVGYVWYLVYVQEAEVAPGTVEQGAVLNEELFSSVLDVYRARRTSYESAKASMDVTVPSTAGARAAYDLPEANTNENGEETASPVLDEVEQSNSPMSDEVPDTVE